jgi:transmembrane sensor
MFLLMNNRIMKSNLFEKITFESLVRFIEGDPDKESAQLIKKWMDSDPENMKLFIRLKEIWQRRSEIDEISREVVDRDFEVVISRIKSGRRGINFHAVSGKPFIRNLIKAAAAVAVVVAITGAYFAGRSGSLLSGTAEVGYNELIVPKGQRSKVVLSDGTSVWVNAGSKLRFPGEFQGNTREVWLDGEGYFNVAKDSLRLFYVHTEDLDIKVHGTTFNLKAYSVEDIIETTLVEGLISIETKNSAFGKDIYLKPNHKAIYIKNESAFITEEIKREIPAPIKVKKVLLSQPLNIQPVISWTEGKLIFSDEPLSGIASKLERRYDVKIIIADSKIGNIKYTGVLKSISIEQALNAIKLTTDITYSIRDSSIIISGN